MSEAIDQPMEVGEDGAEHERHSVDTSASVSATDLPPLSSSGLKSVVQDSSTATCLIESRIPEIWNAFFRQMEHIDQMEKRIEDHISRKRRRIQNVLEQIPSHRRSTVRMFVTHQFDKYTGIWTLVIEGKLLIGNLDHVSAARVEKDGVMSVRCQDDKEELQSTGRSAAGNVKTYAAAAPGSLIPDRNQYKIGAEEEELVEPINFTHLFEKVEVTFRTIYQPRTASTSSSNVSIVKKSRSTKRKVIQPEPGMEVDPSDLRASPPTKLEWNKCSASNPTSASSESVTSDAHAFWVQYNNHFSERPPPPNMKFHSVAAEIKLFPSQPPVLQQYDHDINSDPIYQIANEAFRDRIFGGKYGVANTTNPKTDEGINKEDNSQESQTSSISSVVPGGTGSTDYEIPLENDIQIPLFLSYNEIIMALFQYIQDQNLHDPADKSLIICDDLLTELFGVESINFGYIRPLLLEKGLIKPIARGNSKMAQHSTIHGMGQQQGTLDPVAPVVLTYIMNEKSTSAQVPLGFQEEQKTPSSVPPGRRPITITTADMLDDPSHSPTVLSFDMDVAIPSLFNQRARDLLLNIKKREFEYTTCRTKARYSLVSTKANEDAIKTKIEQSISGQGFIPENIPIFLALARAAHPHSEARSAAQIDARICDLVGRVEESNRKAIAAWDAVDAIRVAMGSEEKADVENQLEMEEY
ncbi:SWIB/MDM2 domain containing protein [Nitzschia inconspicua]|uniref:SWIB/MDM2 domain containing protein n=1 Tax=Nitzschia inconspicua TaxID=303405 RepID=A0A9K3LGC1_9STRA|nr:SWIB/MDM2 domain containing protein [Nitzschia inconspicua]